MGHTPMNRESFLPRQVRELAATVAVAELPGGWTLATIVRHADGTPRRWVASRTLLDKDLKTGDISETRQFESRVDVSDLLGDIRRRNITLGIERGEAPKEVR